MDVFESTYGHYVVLWVKVECVLVAFYNLIPGVGAGGRR